jgi:hypothetical protein
LAKVAIQCSADTFVTNQSLVLRINPPRRMVKIATFAKPENVMHNKKQKHENDENSNFDYFNIYSWKSKWADNN